MLKRFNLLFLILIYCWSGAALADNISAGKAGTTEQKVKRCQFPGTHKRAPAWVCGAGVKGSLVTAVGSAEKSKAGSTFRQQMAIADARNKLAEKLHAAEVMQRDEKMNSKGERGGTFVFHETLQNTRMIRSIYAPNGTQYVLVVLDKPAK
ncbi:MAG: hypothetical protein WC742_04050 [Gallionellaceae bacterium]|jgi:hypothetical protein